MRIALVEPYYGGSHRAWADGYARFSGHDVSLLTHAARFWKWRMHGAFLTLADALADDVAEHGVPDVVLASSMMNVAAFAGAIRHVAPRVPIAVYFHESQFTYPLSPADKTDLTYPMKNWSSAAVADLVIFNSAYHRQVFRDRAHRFLNAFPEDKHTARVDDVLDRAVVLPVGVDLSALGGERIAARGAPLILWNHRWEHDKGPDELRAIAAALIDHGTSFRVAMCGEVFVSVPPAFTEVTDLLEDRLVHQGWADRDVYERLLLEASVVLSTSLQEFFGVGVVEGIAAGAWPVLPDRLVYPERVEALGIDRATSLYADPGQAAELVIRAFASPVDDDVRDAAMRYDWSVVAPAYDQALAALV